MEQAENNDIKIETYQDFVKQLNLAEDEYGMAFSYYKYCYRYYGNFKYYKNLITKEFKLYGLVPIKVTKNLTLIFKYKNIAEAVVYIKHMGVCTLIYKYWLRWSR